MPDLLDIQYRMRLKSFARMVPNQFHRIQNRLTHSPVHHHVTDRQYATREGCHDQNTRDLHRPGPRSYRGHQLHVAAAHAAKHKQEIENSPRQQHPQQAALQSRPAREHSANRQPDQEAAVGQPVGNPPAADVLDRSYTSDNQGANQKI